MPHGTCMKKSTIQALTFCAVLGSCGLALADDDSSTTTQKTTTTQDSSQAPVVVTPTAPPTVVVAPSDDQKTSVTKTKTKEHTDNDN